MEEKYVVQVYEGDQEWFLTRDGNRSETIQDSCLFIREEAEDCCLPKGPSIRDLRVSYTVLKKTRTRKVVE